MPTISTATRNTGLFPYVVLFVFLLLSVRVMAQNQIVQKLQFKKSTLKQVLNSIEDQASVIFNYEKAVVDDDKKVSITISNAELEYVLNKLFDKKEIKWAYNGKYISLSRAPLPRSIDTIITKKYLIKGRVIDNSGEPMPGASVKINGSNVGVASNDFGIFQVPSVRSSELVTVSYTGYESQTQLINSEVENTIQLKIEATEIKNVEVVSTGYQSIPKERATGSFDIINKKLLNRNNTSNIIDRIENLSPGLVINHGDATGNEPLIIRGQGTLFSSARPLIVLNNFPYDGEISNINPNDIESITILKDAAAASIWGAKAANGVIVITTKTGKTQEPLVEVSSNITFEGNPDLYNVNQIKSGDYIDLERFLFNQGRYSFDEMLNSWNAGMPPFSPVVELLINHRDGKITEDELNKEIARLKNIDMREDVQNYLYRNSIAQQHSLSVSGRKNDYNYYLSVGYDNKLENLIGNSKSRISILSSNQFILFKKLKIDAGINFTSNQTDFGNNLGIATHQLKSLYPYAQLIKDGKTAPLYLDYSKAFVDSSMARGFKDWTYNPIDDVSTSQTNNKITNYLLTFGANYSIFKGLNVEVKYQYQKQDYNTTKANNEDSYYARNLVNKFSQFNSSNRSIVYNIPVGGINESILRSSTSHQGRAQLNYDYSKSRYQITAILGSEIRTLKYDEGSNISYGYNADKNQVNKNVDYATAFPQSSNVNERVQIPNPQYVKFGVDNFLSFYSNIGVSYSNKYFLSASARKDQANLFGVSSNLKGVPLYSFGIAYNVSNEEFYNVRFLPYLKLRASYGANGNISRAASAYPTITSIPANLSNQPASIITSPGNDKLKWEKVRTLNIGLEFGLIGNRINGEIEWYNKHSVDLMGKVAIDPTRGFAEAYQNTARMKGRGLDLQVQTQNLVGSFKWVSNFIFSKAKSKVEEYYLPKINNAQIYLNQYIVNPVPGRPLFGIYAYKWNGLDPSTGNPIGELNGVESQDYANILSKSPLDSLAFIGSSQPTIFGAVRNTFSWKSLSASINISYKLDYYFRRQSINYENLFSSWNGSGDYALRWIKPGDEVKTNIPSLVYPNNVSRDNFYSQSSILVEKGDHIRIEDIIITYDFNDLLKNTVFKSCTASFYVYNLGIIWRSNKWGIDPYYNNIPATQKSYSVGLKFSL